MTPVARTRKTPVPAWLYGLMPPPAGYTPLAASVAAKLNPFIARYSPELVSLWSKITERDANGEFIIDVNGFGIGSILDPMQRQEMALWGMIHEAVWRAELPMQTVAGGFNPWPGNKVGVPLVRTGKAGVGGPGGTVGAIEIPRRGLHERTRAVCFCHSFCRKEHGAARDRKSHGVSQHWRLRIGLALAALSIASAIEN